MNKLKVFQYLYRFLFILGVMCLSNGARAQIVALGASNTEATYPSELERMLRAKGVNAHVANAGVSGDSTAGMLARLDSAVPEGTRVVILQPGGNDARLGLSSHISEILARLRSRRIKVIVLENSTIRAIPAQFHQSDRIHLTAEGYRLIAAHLLPQVLSALGSR